ncbi:MAG: hypothetical protein AAFR41_13680, partial [Pseudomonadota bacterium]
ETKPPSHKMSEIQNLPPEVRDQIRQMRKHGTRIEKAIKQIIAINAEPRHHNNYEEADFASGSASSI